MRSQAPRPARQDNGAGRPAYSCARPADLSSGIKNGRQSARSASSSGNSAVAAVSGTDWVHDRGEKVAKW